MHVRRRTLIEVGGPIVAKNARDTWHFRRGLLLALEDEAGHVGYGEASPLPGWSREELATSRWAIEALSTPFEIDAETDAIDGLVREIPPALASARYALETALYDLVAKREGVSVASLLEPRRTEVPLCQLLQEGDRVEAGTVKVKAGLLAFDDELVRLKQIRKAIGPEVGLRLDFNRVLPPLRLYDCLARLAELDVELVEEPATPQDLLKLQRAPVPIALDESLMTAGEVIEDLAGLGIIRALVLKPMLLGGARVSLRIAEWAQQLGLAVTVTHAFDGPVAHAMTSAVALALPGDVLPAGLWPHAGLKMWGERALPHVIGARIVDPGLLGLGVAGE